VVSAIAAQLGGWCCDVVVCVDLILGLGFGSRLGSWRRHGFEDTAFGKAGNISYCFNCVSSVDCGAKLSHIFDQLVHLFAAKTVASLKHNIE